MHKRGTVAVAVRFVGRVAQHERQLERSSGNLRRLGLALVVQNLVHDLETAQQQLPMDHHRECKRSSAVFCVCVAGHGADALVHNPTTRLRER